MNWTYSNIRIFVDKRSGSGRQIMPLLQPLAGGTVAQFYGWESEVVQISGLIVGATDLRALIALTHNAVGYQLDSPEGTIGSFFLKDFKYNRAKTVYQTIRPDLDCTAPVYEIDMELIPNGEVSL